MWDKCSDAFRSRYFIIEYFDGCKTGRIRINEVEV
jgi:hypothetical protein